METILLDPPADTPYPVPDRIDVVEDDDVRFVIARHHGRAVGVISIGDDGDVAVLDEVDWPEVA